MKSAWEEMNKKPTVNVPLSNARADASTLEPRLLMTVESVTV